AIEDFREESKDWKSKYNTELKSWETIAKSVKGMFGEDKQAELKTIAVLEKGKPYALDFIKSAQEQAKMKGFTSPAQLIDFGDQTLPKGISAIDWVRSGAPDLSLEAKPFLDKGQFTGMKTGVFDRQIYPEGMGRIERTEKTYLDTPVGIRKPTPQAEFTDIYSTTEVPGPFGSTEEERFRKSVLATLAARSSKVGGVSFDAYGNANYKINNAEAEAEIERHTDAIMKRFNEMRRNARSIEMAPSVNDARDFARKFAMSDVHKDIYDLGRNNQPVVDDSIIDDQSQAAADDRPTAVDYITPEIENSRQYQELVNPSDTASKKMSKYERRIKLKDYLISQGVPEMTATAYVLNLIPSDTDQQYP
ncbi:MAG: hypothetical protein ACPHEP_09910, partial [Acidimicrobiales bacterium]